jgi:hypothetical protein
VDTRGKAQSRIAQEAARWMIEQGSEDYHRAKLKAAERLGLRDIRQLPRNEAVDRALLEHHRLYRFSSHSQHITALRLLALEVMNRLEAFSPRLVGSVIEGRASAHSPITLHVFSDAPEEVIKTLIEHGIPYRETSHVVSLGKERTITVPGVNFFADHCRIDVLVFATRWIGQSIARKKYLPTQATLSELRRLLETAAPA